MTRLSGQASYVISPVTCSITQLAARFFSDKLTRALTKGAAIVLMEVPMEQASLRASLCLCAFVANRSVTRILLMLLLFVPASAQELTVIRAGRLIDVERGDVVHDKVIFIRGDKGIDYGTVMKVMGRVKAAGFTKVSLITEAEGT